MKIFKTEFDEKTVQTIRQMALATGGLAFFYLFKKSFLALPTNYVSGFLPLPIGVKGNWISGLINLKEVICIL